MNGSGQQFPDFEPVSQQGADGNPLPTTPRELGNPAPPPPHREAPYGSGQAFRTEPRRKRSMLAGLAAFAILAVGAGGAAGAATTLAVGGGGTTATRPASITNVVQADPSHPDWAATAAAVSPAVVAIQVTGPNGSGEGSGVILDGNGNIVTNNHVVSGAGTGAQITVFIGNHAYRAKVVGADPSTDLAVIRLVDPPTDLTSVEFGDSAALRVGDPVMAIGNPLGLSDTVTTGIISALDRPVTTKEVSTTVGENGSGTVVTAAIQTNAAINPGNSGGALVNASGQLVGITSSIATLTSNASAQSGSIGIGFAIPASQVRSVADQLIATGTAQHPQLGVSARDVTNSSQLGAEVAQVVAGSAAADGGLQVGDVITAVDGRPVSSSEALVALIRSSDVGQKVELTIVRNGSEQTVAVTLQAASK